MTEPFVFQISCIVLTLVWALVVFGGEHHVPSKARGIAFCVFMGWASSLIVEGLGLYGRYAGPEPHM